MLFDWPQEWKKELYQGAQWEPWEGCVFKADGTTPEPTIEVKAMVRRVAAGAVRKTFVKDAGLTITANVFLFAALADVPAGTYVVDVRIKAGGEVHYIKKTTITVHANVTRD